MMRAWPWAVLAAGLSLTVQAKVRQVRFTDFARPYCDLTLGGEYPGAKAAGWEKAVCRDLQGNVIPLPCKAGRLHLTETPVYLVNR